MKNLSQKKKKHHKHKNKPIKTNKQTNKNPKAKQKTEDDHYENRTCDYKTYSAFSSDPQFSAFIRRCLRADQIVQWAKVYGGLIGVALPGSYGP